MKAETLNKMSKEARSFIIKAESRLLEIEEEINEIDLQIDNLEQLENEN